ncbi:MAG: glycosyltransferase [Thiobacillus sp.]
MSRKTLHQLYAEHQGKVSDKWSLYLTEYDRLFDDYRDKPVRLLEIGIQNGGSLEIWSKYFSNASALIGCDINPDCTRLSYDDPRIGVIIGDANAPEVHERVLQRSQQFDIIIDDGSHLSSDIIKSFALYFPCLAEGGVFIAEDLHCSYWSQFEGGLFDPYSSISFFKRLADVINHEHWGMPKVRTDILRGIFTKYNCEIDVEALSQVHSVEFINSMCAIRKAPVADNRLGRQIIAGSTELVVPGRRDLHNHPYQFDPTLDQSSNPWTVRAAPPDEAIQHSEVALANAQEQIASLNQAVTERDSQIASLNQAVTERDSQIASLNQAVTERDSQIASLNQAVTERDSQIGALSSSTSWRITRPLRIVAHQFKRVRRVTALVMQVIKRDGDIKKTVKKAVQLYRREGIAGARRRLLQVSARLHLNGQQVVPYQRYQEWAEPTPDELELMRAAVASFGYKPTFSIAVPVYNVEERLLRDFINSVLKQVYPHWELCIADDCSTAAHIRPLLREYAAADPRIKVTFRESNGHISAATNSAIELASGEFMCLMDNDDEIAPNALFEFASVLNSDPDVDMVYSDEDKLDMEGTRYEPFFKPDWSPETLEGCMYTAHFACYRMDIVRKLGGFRVGYDGAQDYDFVLRFTEHAKRIVHVPKVLYHWRAIPGSTASSMDAKDYVLSAAKRALRDRSVRLGGDGGEARLGEYPGSFDLRYPIADEPKVSIVIPSAGRNATIRGRTVDLLANVVRSVYEKTTYRNFEFIVVDNNDLRTETLEALAPYGCRHVHFEGEFNIATKMNLGAAVAGEYLLFMNDDIEVITPDWLECMLQLAQRPSVGAVGAKLLFENGTLQHAGVTFWQGLPDHIRREFPGNDPGYFFSSTANRNYLAVTGAVMLTRRSVFQEVGGFDERFAINYNDIDYCLKVFQTGRRIVFAAGAQLHHFESISRARTVAEQEIDLFLQKWKDLTAHDPYYSPLFEDHPPSYALRTNFNGVEHVPPLQSAALT